MWFRLGRGLATVHDDRILSEEKLQDLERHYGPTDLTRLCNALPFVPHGGLPQLNNPNEDVRALLGMVRALQEQNAAKDEQISALLNMRTGKKSFERAKLDDAHRIKITGLRVTEEEARKAYEEGKMVVLYWSDYPESGLAHAGSCVSKEFRNTFESETRPLESAIFTIHEEGSGCSPS